MLAAMIALIGAGLALFGVMRGVQKTGPAEGVRMIVEIEPPLDADSLAMTEQAARDRVEEKGGDTLVVPAGGRLVVEVSDAPDETAALLERFAKLEIKKGDQVILEGGGIARVGIVEHGVAIAVRGPVPISVGDSLTFALEGKVRVTSIVDRADANAFHVALAKTEDAVLLEDVIRAGAAHPMHVVHRENFSRAVGFLPRAVPFFVAGGVMLLIAALIAFLRKPAKS
jgi:hypothetical protein